MPDLRKRPALSFSLPVAMYMVHHSNSSGRSDFLHFPHQLWGSCLTSLFFMLVSGLFYMPFVDILRKIRPTRTFAQTRFKNGMARNKLFIKRMGQGGTLRICSPVLGASKKEFDICLFECIHKHIM